MKALTNKARCLEAKQRWIKLARWWALQVIFSICWLKLKCGSTVTLRPLLNTEQDIVQQWTLQILLIYSQLQEPETDCLKCFVLRTCNFGSRSHLLLYQKFFCCQFNLKKKYFFLPIFATFVFSKVIYEHKPKISSSPLIAATIVFVVCSNSNCCRCRHLVEQLGKHTTQK